jgi:hypothetical protein
MKTPYFCMKDFMCITEKIQPSIDLSIQKLLYKYLSVRVILLNFIGLVLVSGIICTCEGNILYGDFI